MRNETIDYVVIGSGIAGLRAAIGLSRYGKVLVLTKASVKTGSSIKAQGGIAVVLDENDRFAYHIEDTLKAGAGLCSESRVKILVEEGPARVMELVNWGTHFDIVNGQFLFAMEAAHSKNRIIHAFGDSTGKEVERALIYHIQHDIQNIIVRGNVFCLDLVSKGHTVTGVIAFDEKSKELFQVSAKAVVIATGGSGQIYKDTTNPRVSTGDGISIAFRAGAEIMNMEFIQFHPTALYNPKKRTKFLISEAVRGHGALLRNTNGERFMPNYDQRAELASRDIVARAIFNEMSNTSSDFVYLDISPIALPDFKKSFPTIYKECIEEGVDLKKGLIPVSPSAHFVMGGIAVDENGATSLENLYAVGESACTGVHGANRLASNSLLECLVFSSRAAESIAQNNKKISNSSKTYTPDFHSPLNHIRELMQQNVGIIRTADGLKKMLQAVEAAEAEEQTFTDFSKIFRRFEKENMLTLAYLITKSALMREESRGAHFRLDFPHKDDKTFLKHYIITREKEFWRKHNE